MFTGHYKHWQQTRIEKIVSIFGKEFFNSKTILELACGHGDIGKYFQSIGAIVTFADGRQEHLNKIKKSDPLATTILLDQDNEWDLKTKFDIIIHWGVLYHLNNWKQDLQCAIKHSDLIFLETESCDSDNPDFELKLTESGYDQALNGTGTRPSAAMIETYLSLLGVEYQRYDDSDLNSSFHKYDWKVNNTNKLRGGHRRFWIIKKNK